MLHFCFAEMDFGTRPAGQPIVLLFLDKDGPKRVRDEAVIKAGFIVRVAHHQPTIKQFTEHSNLHFRPLPDELLEALNDSGVHMLHTPLIWILPCNLHEKLRDLECLVDCLMLGHHGCEALVKAINEAWKKRGIHAYISKKEGSTKYTVAGVDGDGVEKIAGLYASWLPEDVSGLGCSVSSECSTLRWACLLMHCAGRQLTTLMLHGAMPPDAC